MPGGRVPGSTPGEGAELTKDVGNTSSRASAEYPFRVLVQSVTDYAIFLLDPRGYVVSWNPGAERMKGYRAEEIIGKHFSKFYPKEAIAASFPDYELDVAARAGRFEDEGWRVRKDGSFFWANVVITALHDESSALIGFGKVTRDLTERRAHEESLRQSEERFRLLVDGVVDYAIFMLDANGRIVTWNTGAERINGYGADEIVGRHFSIFYPKDAVDSGWPEHELHVAAAEGRYQEEGWRVRKDGARFWADVTITALRDESGHLRGFAKLTRDLSERKRAETREGYGELRDQILEAERAARIEAQQTARMKDEFLATLSHELRTPLSAILGWTQVLRMRTRGSDDHQVQQALTVIERNARAQVQLIDDLLELSRILSGQVRLDVQRVPMADVIRGAIESAQPAADAKGVRLESVLDARRGVVSGDAGRLQQVIWNLLSNAIKFTSKGGKVQVLLERVNSHIEVTVSDTGIGISPDFLPHVFGRFTQQDSTPARKYGGLGLGLAISKQLVELHGGSIHAKSAGEGRGAAFIVRLPLVLVEPADGQESAAGEGGEIQTALPDLQGVHVLVVDDEGDARELVRDVLQGQGASVTTVASAEEALAFLHSSKPDVIVSDVGMPGTDGYQLMRTYREREPKGRIIPALALTAFARAEDRKRAMLAGYQAHLAKPFDIAELVLTVASLLHRT
jgi:PAS domain S-box-containing protein